MEQQPLLDIEEGELEPKEEIRSLQEEGITEPCIFTVHEGLRHVNAKAYTPMLVSIGPYHHEKPEFRVMEEHKKRYLELLLKSKKQSKEPYLVAMNSLESEARKCYANSVALNKETFVEMMLLDGCFVIEFLRKYFEAHLSGKDDPSVLISNDDPIFKAGWMQFQICRDLMLLENQLPFSVLSTLLDMTGDGDLLKLAMIPLVEVVPIDYYIPHFYNSYEPKHFLDLVHRVYHFTDETSSSNNKTCTQIFLDLVHRVYHPSDETSSSNNKTFTDETSSSNNKTRMKMPCVMELQEAGVDFKVEVGKANIFDITFERGQLKMPNFTVSDSTEGFFRNMIAYEQHSPDDEPKYFTDFTYFLDKLIDSKEDVGKLRRCGIIDNMLGDDEEVAHMVNRMGDGMFIFPSHTYSKICEEVNEHCGKWWNKEMAKLRRNYFTNPWVTVSTVAAGFLLFLTLTQTVVALMTLFA